MDPRAIVPPAAQPAAPTPSAAGDSSEAPDTATATALSPKARKRTKTGCLTCRKRRIKCGEERPTCVNCIKSKRHCDGYNQRIIFKPPNSWSDVMVHTGAVSFPPSTALTLPSASMPVVLLRPPLYGIPIDESGRPLVDPAHLQQPPAPPASRFEVGSAQSTTAAFSQSFVSPTSAPSTFSISPTVQSPQGQLQMRSAEFPSLSTGKEEQARFGVSAGLPSSPDLNPALRNAWDAQASPAGYSAQDGFVYRMQPRSIARSFGGAPLNVHAAAFASRQPTFMASATTPLDLNEAAIQYQFSDYASTDVDDEMTELDVELPPEEAVTENQSDFAIITDLRNACSPETAVRGYNTFLYSGMLNHYDPDQAASPLKNMHTAYLFMHYLSSTAPSLSIFSRPLNCSSSLFADSSTLDSQQGIWTYTLPAMALNHQGLLHAMLSLSSLHAARLQNGPITPSYKHYAYSIKRMRKCLVERKNRHFPSTLAATLLLGFYEVMTADHSKWSSHLMGASQLLKEINFRWLVHRFNNPAHKWSPDDDMSAGDPLEKMQQAPNWLDLDHDLIHRLSGGAVSDAPIQTEAEPFDAQRYLVYQDLFWWYAKQDVYQSVLSGNRLLWTDCPPRASVGRTDALYGTQDHLILMFARIADFAAKDRARKLRVMESNGGQWRPPHAPPPNPTSAGPREPPKAPPFLGMAPVPQGISMPASYRDDAYTPPYESPKSSVPPDDLQAATLAAVEEWEDMFAALKEFEARFARRLGPLPEDLFPAVPSPFGPALVYASFETAVIWAFYYAAHIVALRGHPDMPPSSLMAAGVAAAKTAPFAMRIGRIAAGMMPNGLPEPFGPAVGAALCEATIPLFVAAVQLADGAQRAWLVARLRELDARTGWASIGLIAGGCETAWERADAARNAPPYRRSTPRRVVIPVPPPDIERQWADDGVPKNEHEFRLQHAAGLIGDAG